MHDIENVYNQPKGIWNFGHTSFSPWAKGTSLAVGQGTLSDP